MCGIASIFAYGASAPPVDRAELLRMREQMLSRGPDGAGEWFSNDGRVGLGHRRLSIIDLSSAGAQPMWNADRSCAIIFNGEIYNYAELRAQLLAGGSPSDNPGDFRGYQFRSHCDTEVLLALYEKRGDAMLEGVRGMYAFAIWDARKQGMLLARDPFGIKPLYYSDNGQTFRVASQVKALRAGGAIDLAPDPAGHVGYFLWGHVPEPYTLYRGIHSLPPGSTMWIDRNGASAPRTFCNITQILRQAEESESRKAKVESRRLSEQLRASLRETVRYHLVADVPVGVFLSSGLDSTAIAALAAEQGGNLRTVTLGFEEYKGTPNDEVPLAEQFAQRLGANHQTIWVSRADFEAERDHLFEAMDRPSTDGVNTFFVSLAAKQANLKVALSGVGGDELFAGYPGFQEIPRSVRFLHGLERWRALGRGLRIVSAPVLKRFTSPKYAGMFEYGGSYSGAYLLRRGMFMPWELPELLDPDLVREGWAELQTLLRLDETTDGISNPRLKVSALELEWYMRNQLLRDSDWAGMGHSVEIRVPLVDIEFVKQITPLLASPQPPSKRDMAAAASPVITPEMLDRRKTGFLVPVREWLTQEVAQVASSDIQWGDRGLRGWAKHIYSQFPGADLSRGTQRYLRRPMGFQAREARGKAQRVLVYRIGQLGDTIMALPAMRAVRKHFPDAHIELLCDRHERTNYMLAADILAPMQLFDGFITYDVAAQKGGRRSRFSELAPLLRKKRFDTIVYLAPSQRTRSQVLRDWSFFKLVGIKHLLGFRNFPTLPLKDGDKPLPSVPSEGDLLLDRLAFDGIAVPPPGERSVDLGLTEQDEERFKNWLATQIADRGKRWIGVGPGCKQPVNEWPLENYESTLRDLITQFDIWPVIFGGSADATTGDRLINRLGRGYNAAGALDVRATSAAMRRCALFVGNDTGTMHVAATANIPCVGVYSSRQWPGLWDPYTPVRKILRTRIDCEGCGLSDCVVLNKECIRRISPAMVVAACAELLCAEALARA